MFDTAQIQPRLPRRLAAGLSGFPREAAAGVTTAFLTLPMCITAGVLAYLPLGSERVAEGAFAGVVSAIVGGAVAALLQRSSFITTIPNHALIQASVLGALLVAFDGDTAQAMSAFVVCGLLTGVWLIAIGATGLARIVKLAPYPVIAGFVSGIGILIVKSQLPVLLAVESWSELMTLGLGWPAFNRLIFALALIAAMTLIARHAPKVPALLAGLVLGYTVFHLLRLWAPDIDLGPVIGAMEMTGWAPVDLAALAPVALTGSGEVWWIILTGSATLALLGTLSTVFTLSAARNLADIRIEQNRDLLGLGAANFASLTLGGIYVSTSTSMTAANYRAGGRGRTSCLVSAALLLLAILLFPNAIFSLPLTVLAAILVYVGVDTIDSWAIRTGRHALVEADVHSRARARRNMGVVALVALATVLGQPIVGAAVGVALACIVFMIDMNRPVVRHKETAGKMRSKRIRSSVQNELLEAHERELAVFELQGVLFFGNADDLANQIDALPPPVRLIILDFRNVSDIDVSGAVALQQITGRLGRRGRRLIFSGLADTKPLKDCISARGGPIVLPDLDAALERFEEEIVAATEGAAASVVEVPLARTDFALNMDPQDVEVLAGYMRHVEFPRGAVLCRTGEPTDRLWLLTRGCISIWVTVPGGRRRVASLGAGCTVGEMGLLTDQPRSADVLADDDIVAYELTASAFKDILESKPHIGHAVLTSIACQLSDRLRDATEDLRLSRV